MTLQSISTKEIKEVKEAIRKINDWNLICTDHIEQMMSQRNFVIRDVINVLINGRLKKNREIDDVKGGSTQLWGEILMGKNLQ